MKDKNYIHVGGGIDPINFLSMIQILEGYDSRNNSIIIINRSDLLEFTKLLKEKNKSIKDFKFFNRTIIINDYWKISFRAIELFMFAIIKNFFYYINLLLFFSYTSRQHYQSRFSHAYWDSCMRNLNDNRLKPSFSVKLKCLAKLILTEIQNEILLNKYPIKTVFLGHSVYNHRITLEFYRKKNKKIFIQGNNCWIKQNKHYDSEWSSIEKNLFKKIKKILIKVKLINFGN